MLLVQ